MAWEPAPRESILSPHRAVSKAPPTGMAWAPAPRESIILSPHRAVSKAPPTRPPAELHLKKSRLSAGAARARCASLEQEVAGLKTDILWHQEQRKAQRVEIQQLKADCRRHQQQYVERCVSLETEHAELQSRWEKELNAEKAELHTEMKRLKEETEQLRFCNRQFQELLGREKAEVRKVKDDLNGALRNLADRIWRHKNHGILSECLHKWRGGGDVSLFSSFPFLTGPRAGTGI